MQKINNIYIRILLLALSVKTVLRFPYFIVGTF